jgi:uncharacterized protein involved in exopolysaccharide biosynthesis
MEHEIGNEEVSFPDIVYSAYITLRAKRFLVFGIIIASLLLGLALNAMRPAQYVASGRLLIDPLIGTDASVTRRVPSVADSMLIDSEVESLISGDLLAIVAEELAAEGQSVVDTSEAETEAEAVLISINALRNNLHVEREASTFVVNVDYEAATPEEAARTVNLLMERFIDWRRDSYLSGSIEAVTRVEEEISSVGSELLSLELQIEEFQATNNMQSTARVDALEEQLSELYEEIADSEALIFTSESYLRVIENVLGDTSVWVENGLDPLTILPGFNSTDINRYTARLNAADTQAGLQNTIAVIENELLQLSQQFERRRDVALDGLQILEARRNELQTSLGDFQQRFVELRDLQRRASVLENRYLVLENRYQQADESANLVVNPVRVLQTAPVPIRPSGPSALAVAFVSVVAGAMIGLGSIFIFEQLNGSLRRPDQLQEVLSRPYWGSVDRVTRKQLKRLMNIHEGVEEFQNRSLKRGQRRQFALQTSAVRMPRSRSTETFRRVMFEITSRGADAHVVALVAARENEGKTHFARNLAFLLANQGRRTLLIDDFRNQDLVDSLSPIVQTDSDYESVGSYRILRCTPNLFVLGTEEGSIVDLDDQLVGELRSQFDNILIDTSPLAYHHDSLRISQLVDAAVLVVRWGATPTSVVRRLIVNGHPMYRKIMGCCFSMTDADMSRRHDRIPKNSNYFIET